MERAGGDRQPQPGRGCCLGAGLIKFFLNSIIISFKGVLEDNKTTAKDWMGKAARAGGCKHEEEELPAACAKRPRRGGVK